jgi:hypothetical protein
MSSSLPARRAAVVHVPNAVFDELLPHLSDTELRVLLVVLRSTVGFAEPDGHGGWRRKQRDWISHGQFIKRTGRQSAAVSRAIASLVRLGLLGVEDYWGAALDTPQRRRRHLGRLYFRVVDKCNNGAEGWTRADATRFRATRTLRAQPTGSQQTGAGDGWTPEGR